MSAPYHSTFTPSKSDRETLERLLVGREDLVRGIMDGIVESARTANKHQRLLIGPRGIGKTHLVSLIYYRARDSAELQESLRIARLREDLYVASYSDLLWEIVHQLAEEYHLTSLQRQADEVLDLRSSSRREAMLEQLLLAALGKATLLLIAENLDDLLLALRDKGQHKLRAFLHNHPQVTILATATSLIAAVSERKKTFFGFFRVSQLRPLSVQEAVELLARLADRAHKEDLAAAVRSPLGLARVRAVHYLAGGNPRIYVLFFDFLSRAALDDLVQPLMKLIDELTPYYQAHMSRLAPLQRRIIDVLRRRRGASTVTEIARQAMTTPQSISSQLSKLRELGYVVQADSLGRSNYYELREPLMRLVLEVKKQKSRNIELFVEFLRVWYSETELDQLAGLQAADAETAHLVEAAQRAKAEPDPLLESLSQEFARHQVTGNHEAALKEVEIALLRAPRNPDYWQRKARCLAALGRGPEERLACWQRVAELAPETMLAWNSLDLILTELGRFPESEEAARRAVELRPEDPILNRNYGYALKRAGKTAEARVWYEKALGLSGEAATAVAWNQRGLLLWDLDRIDAALDAWSNSLELDPRQTTVWSYILGILQEQGRFRLGQQIAARLVEILPPEAGLYTDLGTTLADLGRDKDALAAYDQALTLLETAGPQRAKLELYRAVVLSYLGRDREALDALERIDSGGEQSLQVRIRLLRSQILMWLGQWPEGRTELASVLEQAEPPLWSGKDLRLGIPLARSASPDLWRPFIASWLAAFQSYGRLAEMGQALVRGLRLLATPWITDTAARAWYQLWQELAGDVPELAPPLRLLAAGAEYRARKDPRVLLELAREERGLLEPWLPNLLATEPSEDDRPFEALLEHVTQKLAAEEVDRQSRLFWQSPAPDPASLSFERLLSRYGEPMPVELARLLPGPWQRLTATEAEPLLRQVAAADAAGARAWSRPELHVLAVERRALSFSNADLVQVHLVDGETAGALDLLVGQDWAVVLPGLSATLFGLLADGAIRLKGEPAQSEFTRFFCNEVRGEDGRFQIVDGPEDLLLAPGAELPADLRILPWQSAQGPEPKDHPEFTGTVLYAQSLFKAQLRLQPASGMVEMLDDQPLAPNLACASERFDGPLRFHRPAG